MRIACLVSVLLLIGGCAAKPLSPLIQASAKGDHAAVQRLISEGADINETDDQGRTALMHAGRNGKSETVEVLLKMGADINRKDQLGYTALFLAMYYSFTAGGNDTPEILIRNHADLEVRNINGDTPLLIVLDNCNENLVKLLLGGGADIHARNRYNVSALHYTAKCSQYGPAGYRLTKLFMDKGADVSARNGGGETPLDYALRSGDIDTVALLRKKYDGEAKAEKESTPRIKPASGAYKIPKGKEKAYGNAVQDCNRLTASGTIDRETVLRFQKCMKKMGFRCLGDCSI